MTDIRYPGQPPLRRITRVLTSPEEYPLAQADRIVSRFRLENPVETFDFPEKGNINQHTYLVLSGRSGSEGEYLLQRINQEVFTRPRSVMQAMIASIEAQRKNARRGTIPDGDEWEIVTLVPTREGTPFLETTTRRGSGCWRLMVKIPESRTFKSLGQVPDPAERLRIAREAGRGLALYGDLTAEIDTSGLTSPLPGYRDTRIYYGQLRSVLEGHRTLEEAAAHLPEDPVVRQSTEQHFVLHLPPDEYRRRLEDPGVRPFIRLTVDEGEFAMTLLDEMASGKIRTLAIHGDTKLDNFLFSTRTGRVKALVDLDTIMPHTWLVDWGDMVRSLVNVAGEKETDLSRVQVDMDVFDAVARGFLGTAHKVTGHEVDRMVDAVQIIALELGIRFLSDYLRGDSYFKLGPADAHDLNKTRAMVQLTLFQRLREREKDARRLVREYARKAAAQRKGSRSRE